jgi:hypothetical protein
MRQKSVPVRAPAEQVVKDIRRATRRHFSAEDKIRIVLEGLRGEGQHRRALPSRRHRPEPLLPLVEGLPRGGQRSGWPVTRRGRRPRTRSRTCAVRHPPSRRSSPSSPWRTVCSSSVENRAGLYKERGSSSRRLILKNLPAMCFRELCPGQSTWFPGKAPVPVVRRHNPAGSHCPWLLSTALQAALSFARLAWRQARKSPELAPAGTAWQNLRTSGRHAACSCGVP